MRILLADPEDSLRQGPWSHQRWDLIVDLGRSSEFSADAWRRQYDAPVLRSDSFRGGVEDVRQVRNILSEGRGQLICEQGLDWWDLTFLLLVPEAVEMVALRRMAAEIKPPAEMWATRAGGAARLLSILLGCELRSFGDAGLKRYTSRARHYAALAKRLSAGQIREIFLDKYDARYQWRARFASRRKKCDQPVVLLPSAYGNVSRMAAAYALSLPEQQFLMVATRDSAKQFAPAGNILMRELGDYAQRSPRTSEAASLVERWTELRQQLSAAPEVRAISQSGALDAMPGWIRDGLAVRDAWMEVFEREPICGVLCGDDSNRYTRLPVLLAAQRKIPTADFHHGAFDGHYVLKNVPCDTYLAKNEMERDYLLRVCGLREDEIVIGAPGPQAARSRAHGKRTEGTAVILFSEPYDVLGMRSEEVYRELLPPLCRLARENGKSVTIKLHPFENRSQRTQLAREILMTDDCKLVNVVDGPLREDLLAAAWFGITVESTTVLDCLQNGVACFLCGWLTLSPYEYRQQFARFGVGDVLQTVDEVVEIPRRIEEYRRRPANSSAFWKSADSADLRHWLTGDRRERADAKVS